MAPIAEEVVHAVAKTSPGKIRLTTPVEPTSPMPKLVVPEAPGGEQPRCHIGRRTCRTCGDELYGAARKLCPACWPVARYTNNGTDRPTSMPATWTFEHYRLEILPALADVSLADIERATGLSHASSSRVRSGKHVPNRNHWSSLAQLAGANRTRLSYPDPVSAR